MQSGSNGVTYRLGDALSRPEACQPVHQLATQKTLPRSNKRILSTISVYSYGGEIAKLPVSYQRLRQPLHDVTGRKFLNMRIGFLVSN